jgi:hypothetical protein
VLVLKEGEAIGAIAMYRQPQAVWTGDTGAASTNPSLNAIPLDTNCAAVDVTPRNRFRPPREGYHDGSTGRASETKCK